MGFVLGVRFGRRAMAGAAWQVGAQLAIVTLAADSLEAVFLWLAGSHLKSGVEIGPAAT